MIYCPHQLKITRGTNVLTNEQSQQISKYLEKIFHVTALQLVKIKYSHDNAPYDVIQIRFGNPQSQQHFIKIFHTLIINNTKIPATDVLFNFTAINIDTLLNLFQAFKNFGVNNWIKTKQKEIASALFFFLQQHLHIIKSTCIENDTCLQVHFFNSYYKAAFEAAFLNKESILLTSEEKNALTRQYNSRQTIDNSTMYQIENGVFMKGVTEMASQKRQLTFNIAEPTFSLFYLEPKLFVPPSDMMIARLDQAISNACQFRIRDVIAKNSESWSTDRIATLQNLQSQIQTSNNVRLQVAIIAEIDHDLVSSENYTNTAQPTSSITATPPTSWGNAFAGLMQWNPNDAQNRVSSCHSNDQKSSSSSSKKQSDNDWVVISPFR